MTTIPLAVDAIHCLDTTLAKQTIASCQSTSGWANRSPDFDFAIDYPREATDPRELSEIPEVRLWFVRLDAQVPYLPLLLDWKSGELGRYVAMLVPHQFHPTEGIQYNPEALEIWVMHRVFTLHDWLASQGMEGRGRIKAMTQMLGYELEDAFFDRSPRAVVGSAIATSGELQGELGNRR
ncbi:MAG: CRR6 family NdhI maturation factor [Synechococcales cyanobacterium CRU_2_2]|nr:CRR6 family NdhI maturation factor [Synechococcales cyanobacterium CRU_2_2]